jgi:hypothetical protein
VCQVALGAVGLLALLGTFIAIRSSDVSLNVGLSAFAVAVGLALTAGYLTLWILTRQAHTFTLWRLILAAELAAFLGDGSAIAAIPDPDRFVSVPTVIDIYLTHGLLPLVVIALLLVPGSRRWFSGSAESRG